MIYRDNAFKKTQSNDFEYKVSKSNKMTVRSDSEQEIMKSKQEIQFTKSYRNKNVTIHLEFPSQSDEKATDDFFSRLKEIYLKKLEIKSMQLRDSALQCVNTKEKENEKDV